MGLHKDNEYVARLLQYLYHPEQGDRRLGAPFAGWPMVPGDGHFNAQCLDGDWDGVPDQVELHVIGSNPSRESTSADRYDDGQKFFGITPPNWGYLPRAADGEYVSANLPSFVKWPGRSLFAAAFAKPEIVIASGSITVTAVTQISTDHVTNSGTAHTYGTASTNGTSDAVANTTTWNDWQETSLATPVGGAVAASIEGFAGIQEGVNIRNTTGFVASTAACVGGIATAETGLGIAVAALACPDAFVKAWDYGQSIGESLSSLFSAPKTVQLSLPPGLKLDPGNVNFDTPAMRDALKGCRINASGDLQCDRSVFKPTRSASA